VCAPGIVSYYLVTHILQKYEYTTISEALVLKRSGFSVYS
jgi:hypothetical protein